MPSRQLCARNSTVLFAAALWHSALALPLSTPKNTQNVQLRLETKIATANITGPLHRVTTITDDDGNRVPGGGTYEQCAGLAAVAQARAGMSCYECAEAGLGPETCELSCCEIRDPALASPGARFVCEVGRCCARFWTLDDGFVLAAEQLTAGARAPDGECLQVSYAPACRGCTQLTSALTSPLDCAAAGAAVPPYGEAFAGAVACADGAGGAPTTAPTTAPTGLRPVPVFEPGAEESEQEPEQEPERELPASGQGGFKCSCECEEAR